MPLIPDSSQTRSWKAVEILDDEEQKAVDYLRKRGIPGKLTKRLADLTGKRVVFINMIASMYIITRKKEMTMNLWKLSKNNGWIKQGSYE